MLGGTLRDNGMKMKNESQKNGGRQPRTCVFCVGYLPLPFHTEIPCVKPAAGGVNERPSTAPDEESRMVDFYGKKRDGKRLSEAQ